MQKNKRTLQKVAGVVSKLSVVTAVICAVILYLKLDQADEVFKSSMGATIFFFGMVGIVLSAIANTDIPNLTPGQDEESSKLDEEKNSHE